MILFLGQDYMASLTVSDGEESFLSNSVRSDGSYTLDNATCVHRNSDLCVDNELRLFHAQTDGTIPVDEEKYLVFQFLQKQCGENCLYSLSAMMGKLDRNWCAVIRHGGQAEWKWAWQASQSDEWAHKRNQILSAMSCSQDRSRLKQLLSRVFHPTLDQDPQDTTAMIEKMTENPTARSMAMKFIKTNWDFLGRQYELSLQFPIWLMLLFLLL